MKLGTFVVLAAVGFTGAARAGAQAAPAVAPGAAPAPAAAPAAAPPVLPTTAAPANAVGPSLPDRAPPELEGIEPEAGGLTADEVARRALTASATVKEKNAEVEAANEKITETTVTFFPKLTLLASYTRTSPLSLSFGTGSLVGAANAGGLVTGPCAAGGAATCVVDSGGQQVQAAPFSLKYPNNNYAGEARLSIPLSDYLLRVSDAAASSSSSRDAARLSVAAEKLKVASDARTLYFNWLRARAQAAIAKKTVEQVQARLEDARAAFNVGTSSKADLLRIEALVANTELTQTRADSLVSLTAGQLAIVMEDPRPNYRVGEGVPPPNQVAGESESVEQLTADAQARRLEIKSVNETVKAYHRGAGATRSGAFPRIDGIADALYANPNPRYFPPAPQWNLTWSVGVQASWTINDTFSNSATANELDANARNAEAKRIELRQGVAQEVLGAYTDLTRARAAYDKQRAALDSAQEAYRVTTDLFRAGRATGTDLIGAETDLLDAKLGDVNARIDLSIAAIELRHATGRDVPTDQPTASQ